MKVSEGAVAHMTWRRWTAVAVAVTLAAVLGGVLFVVTRRAPPARLVPASPSPSVAAVSPFTGEPGGADGPVLAVKIDNIRQARPPTGLSQADITYVEPVEGGLSRILAVFAAHQPPLVGPIRSARESDLELLRQFGTPAFAYSGAQSKLLRVVHRSRLIDLYVGLVPRPYVRDHSRPPPHNLYAHPRELLRYAAGASRPRDIGFRFGAPPPGGRPVAAQRVSYSAASFAFSWSAGQARWLVSMDGRPAVQADGTRLSAATVVIQYTQVVGGRFLEQGHPPPLARTVGAGSATVLRDGLAYQARWSRPQPDGGTTYTLADGRPMTFTRGPVWVVLAPG